MSYEAAVSRDYPVVFGSLFIFTLFGLFVSGLMYMIRQRHLANQAVQDDVQHLDDTTHH